jgi:hypothetical protein
MAGIFNLGINKASALDYPYINYYGIEISEVEYKNLANLGFTEREI